MTLPFFSPLASRDRAGIGSSNAAGNGSEEGSAAAAAQQGATSSRRRRSRRRSGLRDIFAIPTHRPTTAATDGYGSDDGVMDAPRVGRPQPGPSMPTTSNKPLPREPVSSSIQRAKSLQNKAPPPYTKRRAPGDAEIGRRRAAGERFPRWRGWLEKRALERHGSDAGEDVRRKKSWGAWVNDADAVEDEGGDDGHQDAQDANEAAEDPLFSQPPIPPPLHVHQLGSRFLPHLTSPPFCAVYLTIPPPPLPRRLPPRPLLLVGTADGLFAVEHGKPRRGARDERGWNQDMRCTQIWSGLAVYQLAILHDNAEPPPAGGPSTTTMATSISLPSLWGSRSATASSTPSPGVMLGLCSSAPASMSPRSRFSMLGSNHSSTAVDSASSTTSHGPTPSVAEEGPSPPASFHFGVGAGSLQRAGGSNTNGIVKLWNLDSVIRVVSYVLDDPQATHLDLSTPATTQRSGSSRLSRHFRNAWSSISEMAALSNERPRAMERRAESDSYGVIEPRAAPSQRPRPRSTLVEGDQTTWQPASSATMTAEGQEGNGDAAGELDEHSEALKLAQAATSIDGLATGQAPWRQSNTSAAVLDEERRHGSAASPLPASSSSSAASSASTSKGSTAAGCSFFAVHEAAAGTKGAGTWFLALASPRGIRLYEATPRRRGGATSSSDQARSWVFLKEFYTPLPPKAMAFASTATAMSGMASTSAAAGHESAAAPSDGRDSPSSSAILVHTGGKAILSLDDEHHSHSRKASRPRPSLWSGSSSGGGLSGLRGSSGVLRPQHGGGAAGPRSWSGADLSLFVSFGRRAVVIRLSDSHVREVDVVGGSAAAERPLSPAASETMVGPTSSSNDHHARPQHLAHHRRRSSSLEMLGAFDRQAAAKTTLARKQQQRWVGLEVVQCQIAVRERVREEGEEGEEAVAAARSAASTPGLPSSAAATSSGAPTRPAFTAANSMPTLLLGGVASPHYQPHVESDTSDDDDDDDDAAAEAGATFNVSSFRGIELHDGPQPRQARRKPLRPTLAGPTSTNSSPSSIPLLASLTLLTRGSTTHVLPYPLPADLVHPTGLIDALQWSDVPDAVTGWSRVLGMQRASSSGPLSTSALAAKRRREQKASSSANTAPSPTVSLQISLTALASFPHRTETRRVTVWLDVPVPASLSRSNVELEIIATAAEETRMGAGAGAGAAPVLDPAVRPSLATRTSQAVVEHAYPTGIVVPCPQVGGSMPRALFYDGAHKGQRNRDGSGGDEAVSASSLPDALVAPARLAPEGAVGDGGAWCAVQKGGGDYRLCYIGAEV